MKVVLSADGGDELFAGYNIYASMLGNVQRRDAIPLSVRRMVGTGMSMLPLDAMDERLATSPYLPDGWRGRRRPTFRLCRMRDWLGSTTNGQMYQTALGNSWWADDAATLRDCTAVASAIGRRVRRRLRRPDVPVGPAQLSAG